MWRLIVKIQDKVIYDTKVTDLRLPLEHLMTTLLGCPDRGNIEITIRKIDLNV